MSAGDRTADTAISVAIPRISVVAAGNLVDFLGGTQHADCYSRRVEVRMSKLTDCPSCGGLLPEGRACCPHCHCKYPAMKRWRLVAAAALGVGAAGCGDSSTEAHDASVPDASVYDGAIVEHDLAGVEFAVEYGPALIVDVSTTDGNK
jgi:hypothetical protein